MCDQCVVDVVSDMIQQAIILAVRIMVPFFRKSGLEIEGVRAKNETSFNDYPGSSRIAQGVKLCGSIGGLFSIVQVCVCVYTCVY